MTREMHNRIENARPNPMALTLDEDGVWHGWYVKEDVKVEVGRILPVEHGWGVSVNGLPHEDFCGAFTLAFDWLWLRWKSANVDMPAEPDWERTQLETEVTA